MKARGERLRDMQWLTMFATRPFLGTKDDPPPELPPNPMAEDYAAETEEDRFERLASVNVPVGAKMVGNTRVYSLGGGDGTWVFKRDPREFE